MRRAALAGALLATVALGSRPVRGDEAAEPASATALYDAAVERWKALPVPDFASYRTDATAIRKGHVEERKSRVWYRERDGRCTIVGVALDARDRPDPPDFETRCLSPGYSFGFVPERRAIFGPSLPIAVATPDPGAAPDLKQIGAITVRSRPYAVSLAGTETVDGKAAIHLALRPYREPARNVLRDLWIDPATDGVIELRGEAEATANLVRVVFVASYDEAPQQQTLRRIAGYAKAQLFLLKIGADFTYDLSDFAYPANLPDWYFDRTACTLNGGIPTSDPTAPPTPEP